jgi:hypothetical protein
MSERPAESSGAARPAVPAYGETAIDPALRIGRRRAIEALRSGVPNRDAVAALGSGQPEIEERFETLLEMLQDRLPAGPPPGGLLLEGGFGSGKSHLLTHLAQLASNANFVVSTVVVSKETPLYHPGKVLRAAVDNAVVPGDHGAAVEAAAGALDPASPAFAELVRWASSPSAELNERFAASLLLYAAAQRGELPGEEEFVATLLRFWAGDPLRVSDLRRRLKMIGERKYPLSAVTQAELARQRFRFLSRLFTAASYAGWVIFFDEVELIGRYSVLQRGRSYAELARWLRGDPEDPGQPIVAVAAMTDDFEAAVISDSGKNDRERVPEKLRAKQRPDYDLIAGQAEDGMRLIERASVLLHPPDAEELDRAYGELRRLHGQAFGWQPPEVPGLERLGATRMRQHVRAWINEWDLARLDPSYSPSTVVSDVATNYAEDTDLEDGADRLVL